MIRISTITPCFRMKPYLKLFLDELPKQTFFDHLEVVLDHNEPDEEEIKWVKDFQNKYPGHIKHLITNPVVPIGTSMNRCIKEASGELLTIWNVDDLRTDNSIELMVEAFDNGADIVYGNFEVVRSFGSKSGKLVDFSKYQDQPTEFTRSMLLGPFMAFRKSLCEKAGYFDEQLKSGADFDLAIRLAFHGKPGFASGLLGYYLNEGKGASTRPNSRQQLERTAIELRYGIYDKIDYDYVVEASQLDILHIHAYNQYVQVSKLVPDYHKKIRVNFENLHARGLWRYVIYKLTFRKIIRTSLVKLVKKIIYKQ